MYKIGENEMVTCPYNRSHVVNKLRIQKHISKCKNRHPEVKLITCFYNFAHRLKPEEALKHYEICSQKMRMEESRYSESNRCNSYSTKSVYDSMKAQKKFTCNYHNHNSENNIVKSKNIQASEFKTVVSPTNSVKKDMFPNDFEMDLDDDDDLKPLSLPKTVSKAFNCVKTQTKKSLNLVPASQIVLTEPKGISRGKDFMSPENLSRTNDLVLHDLKNMEDSLPEKITKPKYLLESKSNAREICSVSIISSLMDDDKTLKSDDITFEDEEDNEDNKDLMFKNFDKYVRI